MDYVILDTSSILFGFSNMNDIFEAAEARFPGKGLMISKGVIRELEGISKNKGKKGLYAKAALLATKYKRLKVNSNSDSVDSWILSEAVKTRSVVITNDTELYKKLKSANIECFKLSKSGLLK